MTKIFCDCCGNEILSIRFSIPFHVHILEHTGYAEFVEGKWHPISGRIENKTFCISCYNEIMFSAFDKMKEIQDKIAKP